MSEKLEGRLNKLNVFAPIFNAYVMFKHFATTALPVLMPMAIKWLPGQNVRHSFTLVADPKHVCLP